MRSALGCWEAWLRINEGCRSWTMLHAHSAPVRCLLGFIFRKFTFAISSPDEFLSISQSNAEELDRRAGKTKHCLISYFLSNASAKNYRNRIVYVKIIARGRCGVFLGHSVERSVSMVILDSFRELSRSQKVFTWIHHSNDLDTISERERTKGPLTDRPILAWSFILTYCLKSFSYR